MRGQIMRVHATALTAALSVLAGLPVSGAHAAGPSLWLAPAIGSGSCTFKNTEIATADSFDESNSTSFVDLKDAGSIAFKQARTGCVAGSFFANAGNESADDHVLLQVLLDGVACAPLTGGYVFANSGSDFTSHSVAFFCGAKIAAGKHTIRVQYASGLGGKSAFFQHTLEVVHQ
jgi:hypothetical protein